MRKALCGLQAVIFCILLWTGCSVKENRRECPCRLFLDFSETDAEEVPYADLHVLSSEGFHLVEHVGSGAFGEELVLHVPRRGARVNAYCGAEGYVYDDGRMEIPYGSECPHVHMHSSYVETDCEAAYEKVRVRKNYCLITVHVEEADFPYVLDVRGEICGYGVDGSPADGAFLFAMRPDGNGVCSVSVPRQVDNSLRLDVDDGTDVLKTFALGEYVTASGYDWSAESLGDITIGLDYSLSHVTLKIEGWEKELHFDVEI